MTPMLGIMASSISGSKAVTYFINLTYDSTYTYAINLGQAKSDSSGNSYAAAYPGTAAFGFIAKYNSSGVKQWIRSFTPATGLMFFQGLTLDSSANAYAVGRNSGASNSVFVAKYNSSGTIQWQKSLTTGTFVNAIGAYTDSSDGIYITGGCTISAIKYGCVIKLDTTGAITWQRIINTTSQGWKSIATDSSNNSYVTGQGSTSALIELAKYNSSGTIQWQKTLITAGAGPNTSQGVATAVDSAGALLIGAVDGVSTSYIQGIVAKYDSAGALTWQRALSETALMIQVTGICTDSSNNVYAVGYKGNNVFAVKYNSSGTIQWQRQFYYSTIPNNTNPNNAYIDSSGSLCFTFYSETPGNANGQFMLAKVPTDGSKTGTYTIGPATITYGASSMTDAAGTATAGTSAFTDTAGAFSITSSSATDASLTLTSTTTTIQENMSVYLNTQTKEYPRHDGDLELSGWSVGQPLPENWVPVETTPAPIAETDFVAEPQFPILINDVWTITWKIRALTKSEIHDRDNLATLLPQRHTSAVDRGISR